MKLLPTVFKKLMPALLSSLVLSTTAHAWWNNEWTMRKKITLDTSSNGVAINDGIGNTTVLIRLHDGDFQFGAAKDDGSDLRCVAADDKTLLPFQIEKFDSLLTEAFVWVKLSNVKPGTQTSFWLYYGNPASKAPTAEDSKGTFDSDAALVYHFSEKGAPASDSSSNGNNAQNPGVPLDGSMIGSGIRLDGKASITIPSAASLLWTDNGAMTWSAWVKPTALAKDAIIFSRRDGANALLIGLDNGAPFVQVTRDNSTQRSQAGAPVAVNSWHHLAVVAESGKVTVYLDGENYAALGAPLPALNSASLIGVASADGSAPEAGFTGEMDELEISKVARPAGFIKLEAISQGGEKAAKIMAFSPDEQKANLFSWLETGTFGVIIKSLTVDGWAVIIILMCMSGLSWFVMVSKVRNLNRMAAGNEVFLKAWKHVANDLTILDDPDVEKSKSLGGLMDKAGLKAMRSSSVYRIYHLGVEEIRHRLAADKSVGTNGRKGLAGRSIQAIRASLDGGLVRENQRINSLIVLLTICISGGPFLGLLGTVIGVMITFAAVAAAGEVNVNAIAPGIAAALLATVAGLAVAIPALFGYNYILSRVKDARDDMHIFIDEFVAKTAEFYKE